jgi:hypothetical protein
MGGESNVEKHDRQTGVTICVLPILLTSMQVPPIYALDTTDPSRWHEHVYTPAERIVDAFLHAHDMEQPGNNSLYQTANHNLNLQNKN